MTNPLYSLNLKKKTLLIIGLMITLIVSMFPFSKPASAHGYVDSPGSRAAFCKAGTNQNCGPIIYEPQSLEAPKGFPQAGPADGKIASAGGAFPTLDEQTASRWSKVNMTAGQNTFTWKISARHATTSWKYYITKQNWDPNAPLTRNSFDLTPFCSVNYNGQQPPATYSDTCNVPSRTGYQVILAVWEIADTPNAFYNVIDANFSGSTNPNPGDTVAPTAPSGLASSNITANSVALAWAASTDNVGVSGYRIYKNSTLQGTTSGTALSYSATGLTANTAYTFTVRAIDAAGNESANSNSISITTSQAPAGSTTWAPNTAYTTGTIVSYNGVNYQCRQPHTSINGWEPPNVASLWLQV